MSEHREVLGKEAGSKYRDLKQSKIKRSSSRKTAGLYSILSNKYGLLRRCSVLSSKVV